MLIRPLSDLHLEMGPFDVPVIPNEKDIVCVLAGDIAVIEKPHYLISFLHNLCKRHKAVIYVFGNHEFWYGSLIRAREKLTDTMRMGSIVGAQGDTLAFGIPSNLYILEKETIEIDGVVFIGTTMWTNFDKGNPLCVYDAPNLMNDYDRIRTGTSMEPYKHKLRAPVIYGLHIQAHTFLFDAIRKANTEGKTVVAVTHHGLSLQSITPEFRNAKEARRNPYYSSDYEKEILETQPALHIHGHTHVSIDYDIEATRVICNPRGYYPDHLVPDFDPCKLIKV